LKGLYPTEQMTKLAQHRVALGCASRGGIVRPFRLAVLVSVLAAAFNVMCQERSTVEQGDSGKVVQHFACNSGYTVEMCRAQIAILRAALAPYHPERLGEWTWVLVRSEDWRPILRRVGKDPDSPIFTILEKRQTFVEEGLLVPITWRRAELLQKWSMPLNEFLDFAIVHELVHAYCYQLDERRTEENAHKVRQEKHLSCKTP
jgi:hypothetical protein